MYDQKLLEINGARIKSYEKEQKDLDNELYKGPGNLIMEQFQTYTRSFEIYQQMQVSEVTKIKNMIYARMRERIKEAMMRNFVRGITSWKYHQQEQRLGIIRLRNNESLRIRFNFTQPMQKKLAEQTEDTDVAAGMKKRLKLEKITNK